MALDSSGNEVMSNQAIAKAPTVPGGRLDVSQIDNVLTLANGMTAGYGVQDNHNDNWPLAYPGSPHYGYWRLQPKRVGYIRNIANSLGGSKNKVSNQYTLYFMYNPNEIDVTWSMAQGGYSPLYMYGMDTSNAFDSVMSQQSSNQNQNVPGYANAQSVTWTLYFDRTYDMMYGTGGPSAPDANSAEDDRGVLKDIAALYNLMGAFLTNAAVPISVPSRVVFGQNGAGQLFGFTGYLSNVQISYGVFRHDMIPSMAQVQLTLTCAYVGNQAPAGSGAASYTWTPEDVLPGEIPFKPQGPPPPIKVTPQNPSGLPGSALNPVSGQPSKPSLPPPPGHK